MCGFPERLCPTEEQKNQANVVDEGPITFLPLAPNQKGSAA
jgi:hypothetical protein